VKIEGVVLPI